METSKTFTIQLTSDQKELFDNWLAVTEKDLEVRLNTLRNLRKQTNVHETRRSQHVKSKILKSQKSSWTSKTINVLAQLQVAQTSTHIVAWLMDHDEDLKNKDRRYITKNVTSKLSLLVEKGRVEKNIVNGKNVYALKNQE